MTSILPTGTIGDVSALTSSSTTLFLGFLGGDVWLVGKTGAPAMAIAFGGFPVGGVAVDGTDAFFTSGASIYTMPTAGGTKTKVACDGKDLQGVAVDATTVYWAERGDFGTPNGRVLSAPR